LEDCEVQKDIFSFIKVHGTGQEIPDPPKFIDFCRGDATEHESEDGGFSTAQFQRPINPAHRTSSPQPSLLESHHDPKSTLVREMGGSPGRESPRPDEYEEMHQKQAVPSPYGQKSFANSWVDVQRVPHNEHPQHGMTQFCRTGPVSGPPSSFAPSDLSSGLSQNRPESRESYSEYSNPSRESYEQRRPSASQTPVKQSVEEQSPKKSSRSWIKSPFRRPSKPEKEPQQTPTARSANRNTWGASMAKRTGMDGSGNPNRRSIFGGSSARSPSPDPIDPNSKIQLNVGTNVFDISTDTNRKNPPSQQAPRGGGVDDPYDPLVQALDELNRVASKASKTRDSADRHFQIPSPAPPRSPAGRASPLPGAAQTPLSAAQRGTPPPSYDSPMARSTLGAPPAAHTSREMQNTTSRYVNQRRGAFESPTANRGQQQQQQQQQPIRAISPSPGRRSPQPGMQGQQPYRPPSSQGYRPTSSQGFRGPDPGPGYDRNRPRGNTATPQRPGYGASGGPGAYGQRGGSPGMNGGGSAPRARSPQPGWNGGGAGGPARPHSSMAGGDMALQVSRAGSPYGSIRSGGGGGGGPYDAAGVGPVSTRVRSKSVAEARQYSKDGRVILNHGELYTEPTPFLI
jgi:hypothetical protein